MGILALRCPNILPLSLRRATPTLETLAYDCGNPVQYVCGHLPALPCHSRARGPHKYECICGVDKAGIGLGLLLVI